MCSQATYDLRHQLVMRNEQRPQCANLNNYIVNYQITFIILLFVNATIPTKVSINSIPRIQHGKIKFAAANLKGDYIFRDVPIKGTKKRSFSFEDRFARCLLRPNLNFFRAKEEFKFIINMLPYPTLLDLRFLFPWFVFSTCILILYVHMYSARFSVAAYNWKPFFQFLNQSRSHLTSWWVVF
jgi:hypothetical protein